jgi:hypothetical protein
VFEFDDPDRAGAAVELQRLIKLRDHRAQRCEARGVGHAQQDRIAARVDLHRRAGPTWRPGGATLTGRVHQALQERHHVCRHGVLEAHHLDFGADRQIDRSDDAADATQIVGVVGDDERVVACVGVDRVVRADQGPQDRHQVVGRLVLQAKDLRQHLIATSRRRSDHDYGRLKLGVGFRHHLEQALDLDHGEAQAAQRCEVVGVDLLRHAQAVV